VKSDKLPANSDIRAHRIILIGSDGSRMGEFLRNDAIRMAEDDGLDLVAVGGTDDKPVCKIMDYGKFLYAQKKKFKRNITATTKTKEIKIGFVSDDNYVNIKTKQAEKFLREGNRVKVTIRFKGRESTHINMIIDKCLRVYDTPIPGHKTEGFTLEKIATVDAQPKRSGRQVTMLLSPRKVFLEDNVDS